MTHRLVMSELTVLTLSALFIKTVVLVSFCSFLHSGLMTVLSRKRLLGTHPVFKGGVLFGRGIKPLFTVLSRKEEKQA